MKRKEPNVMEDFEVLELSAVDRPAQSEAQATIIKNEIIDQMRDTVTENKDAIITTLRGQMTAAGPNLEALNEVLQRALSINFDFDGEPFPEFDELVQELRSTIQELSAIEERTTRKSEQVRALAKRLQSTPDKVSALQLRKYSNDLASEIMQQYDHAPDGLEDPLVQELYEIADHCEIIASQA